MFGGNWRRSGVTLSGGLVPFGGFLKNAHGKDYQKQSQRQSVILLQGLYDWIPCEIRMSCSTSSFLHYQS